MQPLFFYFFCFCWLGNLNNCWSVTKLMALFCLLQNNSTSKSTEQMGPSLCIGMLSCSPLAECCGISDWAIPDVRLITVQKNLLLSSLVCCTLLCRFKSWELSRKFSRCLNKFIPDVTMLWDYAKAFVFKLLNMVVAVVASGGIFIVRWRKEMQLTHLLSADALVSASK